MYSLCDCGRAGSSGRKAVRGLWSGLPSNWPSPPAAASFEFQSSSFASVMFFSASVLVERVGDSSSRLT